MPSTSVTMTPKLRAFQRLVRATNELRRARREFNAAVVQALNIGWSAQVIARETGMSQDTVYRIRQRLEKGYPEGGIIGTRVNGAESPGALSMPDSVTMNMETGVIE